MEEKLRVTTVRLPDRLWLALRRLQEAGVIRSMSDGIIKAITAMIDKEDK